MSYKGKKGSNLYESREGYDLYASNYDEKLEYLNSFEGHQLKMIMPEIKGKKVLDAGCGTGRLTRWFLDEGAEYEGIDLSAKMIDIACKKFPDLKFTVGDATELPYEDESFDIVCAAFLLVHLRNLREFFDEVYRVLKPGGNFVVTNINQRKAPKLKTEDKRDIVIDSTYHRPENIVAGLEDSFFRIEEEKFVEEDGVWINQIIKAVK